MPGFLSSVLEGIGIASLKSSAAALVVKDGILGVVGSFFSRRRSRAIITLSSEEDESISSILVAAADGASAVACL